jgi:hypothetical protein
VDPSTLMAGPRGRRLLLQFALDSEERAGGHERARALRDADRVLDPDSHAGAPYASSTAFADAKLPRPTTEELERLGGAFMSLPSSAVLPLKPREMGEHAGLVEAAARALAAVELVEATWATIRHPLADTVAWARYWQPPEGKDLLLERQEMRESLERVARHLSAAPVTRSWSDPIDARAQVSMLWDGADPIAVCDAEGTALAGGSAHLRRMEERARRERDADPRAHVSGEWWSAPRWPAPVPQSTALSPDGSPHGAPLVEDDFGWEEAYSVRLEVPAGLKILDIASAEVWADLCRRFSIDVTAQKRHDWFRTTGRDGAWVVPDWAAVAAQYDAVHLPITGYLSAAGRAIPVMAGTASLIAGWDPDATYWFTDRVRYAGGLRKWEQKVEPTDIWWQLA